jgi:hypothetical protein
MISAIIPLATEVLHLLNHSSKAVRAALLPVLMTAALNLTLYAGWHVVQQGDLGDGLRAAFLNSNTTRAHDYAHKMQLELQVAATSDRLIHGLLQDVLETAGNAARVRLSVIHNGQTMTSGTGMLRFDITHAVTAPGRDSGVLVTNQPLSEWADYLPTLLAANCITFNANDVHNANARARMGALGMQLFVACPVINLQGVLLGAIFVSWDHGDTLPAKEDLPKLYGEMKHVAAQVAIALDMRPAASLP